MRGHPGDRVRLLVEARAQHVDRRDEAVGVIGGGAQRPGAALVHRRHRVDRRRDAFQRPLLAIHEALGPVARVLRAEAETVLPEVLHAGFEAMNLGVVAIDRTADVEQVAFHADVLARLPAAGDLVLDPLVESGDVEDRILREVPLQRDVRLLRRVRLQVDVAAEDLRELTPGDAFGGVGGRELVDRRPRHGLGGAEPQLQLVGEAPGEVGRRQHEAVVAILLDLASDRRIRRCS